MIEGLINEYSAKCSYVDCRVSNLKNEAIILENGETNNIFTENKCYGVRVLVNGSWGFSFSSDFSKAKETFNEAFKIACLSKSKSKSFVKPSSVNDSKVLPFKIDPFSIEPVEKIKLMKEYESLFKKEARVKNSMIILQCEREIKTVYAPDVKVSQEFTNNIFRARVTAQESGVIQSSSKNYAHLGGYESITGLDINEVTGEVLSRVKRLLHAKSAKPERATVVCDPQMTGLFFHEAVGHACEADAIVNKASVFNGLKDKLIASEEVNLYDDPTIEERGFYWYDDEGVKARASPLIVNGVLAGYMSSLISANDLGIKPSGNGRSMNAQFTPIPRMSNTNLRPGKHSFNDLIKEAGNGYLAKGFAGGVVDPVTGQFSFAASECFKIVNGEVGEPLRDVTLAGNILEILKTVKSGRDCQKTNLTGTCGKYGQSVRVGDFCPSILVREVIIGGHS